VSKSIGHFVGAALATLCASGCVSANATMLGFAKVRYAPVVEGDVLVYVTEDHVPAACTPYALIHASGSTDVTNEAMMIAAARRRAGKIGANAIALRQMRDPSTGTQIAGALFGVPANRKGQMLAYRCAWGSKPPPVQDSLPTPRRRQGLYGPGGGR
jgi:hypothetical protein